MSIVSHPSKKIEVVDCLPKPQDLPDGSIYGYYSVTLPKGKKLIPYHFIKQVGENLDTETAFTREFLKSLGRRKVRQAEYFGYRLSRPPLFVRPSIMEDAVYIDLKCAFPSIYKSIGWNTDYIRGQYWGVGDPLIYPFPMEWKAGRSYVVTGARHIQHGRYISKGIVKTKPYLSQFSNPPLVAGVYDVLGCIARFAEYAMQGLYWNVDGGIMPLKALDIFIPFVESLGLKAAIKYTGRAVVLSSGYWSIGSHETKRMEAGKSSRIHKGDYIGIDKEQAEWIYKNFKKIAERNI